MTRSRQTISTIERVLTDRYLRLHRRRLYLLLRRRLEAIAYARGYGRG